MNRAPVFSRNDPASVTASKRASRTRALRREVSSTSAKERRRMQLERERSRFRESSTRGDAMGVRNNSKEE